VSLNLARVARQLEGLLDELRAQEDERRRRLRGAQAALQGWAGREEALAQRAREAQETSWLLALPLEPLNLRQPSPAPPADYTALATDGSSIDVDRHSPVHCYLINLGYALIRYGQSPQARLESQPSLEMADRRLFFGDRSDASREDVITGNLLGALRTVREVALLTELVEGEGPGPPLLALVDGTFLLWGIDPDQLTSEAREALLEGGILAALERLRSLAREGRLLFAGYISRPQGWEVINTLRLTACPYAQVNCRVCRREHEQRPCDVVAGGPDRALFSRLLGPGERGPLFLRHSKSSRAIENRYYAPAGHGLAFFYLNTGGEVVRVEVPLWMVEVEGAIARLQALILDQCRRGRGYPLVLTEAHEQAVITGPQREAFRQLLEGALAERGIGSPFAGKGVSKRVRWL